MKPEDYKNAYEVLRAYEICCVISTDNHDYYIGTREELQKNLMQHIFAFNQNLSLETIKETELYQRMVTKTIAVPVFQTLMELKPKVVKVLAFSNNLELLAVVKKKLGKNPNLAVASSSPNNLEITDVVAQKGPVLKNYIESLGYSMEEVMVFGDSLNDYSMLSMEFGATIAMENAVPEVKAICKYVTKSNVEDGVAHAIEELLKKQVVGK